MVHINIKHTDYAVMNYVSSDNSRNSGSECTYNSSYQTMVGQHFFDIAIQNLVIILTKLIQFAFSKWVTIRMSSAQ